MSVRKFTSQQFDEFVSAMLKTGRPVIAPQAKDDRFAFGPLSSPADLRLDYDVTILPPKKYVLPQVEPLLEFEVFGPYQSVYEGKPMILLGVHPYDLAAILQTDELFRQGYYDKHYMDRRKQITIIALDVVRPSINVFASSMGTATISKGYDILLTVLKDGSILADAATDKGQELLRLAGASAPASEADLKARKAVWDYNAAGLNKHVLLCKPSFLPKLLEQHYNHPVWEEKARLCYSCGSCNMVCPTCYCFDVQDQVDWNLKNGQRARCWDGCLLEHFAVVAGNHNFRKERSARFRHRLYRKGKYVPAKIGGEIACVGCGRCITACTAKIANPVDVYNRLIQDTQLG
ncbi:MAG TPA: 4Fe-4S dicluster domain-containing protein [Anaerohalosphaeraceae bacterium]|jgi:NAD-dependent dihydropyrimidine dehydrogenase PreA subunit|nr:4Fe-4S dicluster domain-containing protein [Anaerohalosphaeraceae bacterium]HQG04700.1 4Fe-4S dicluster domain-containing protein [Anaerohalosphaeraceae bacterium]HQI06470.1 4Fe-4S dicluster domain-containing protein [Anaerohalosphaeraceae bacterium]HQJ66795.1 4Fe-4S dicluster domain-containing protein [Anaerohalosphaeraceae bacterium]